jgi:hypothetical protein
MPADTYREDHPPDQVHCQLVLAIGSTVNTTRLIEDQVSLGRFFTSKT